MRCSQCGTDEDVIQWSLDIDLPTLTTCKMCAFLLLHPLEDD